MDLNIRQTLGVKRLFLSKISLLSNKSWLMGL